MTVLNDFVILVKTPDLRYDQRVLKIIDSARRTGRKIHVFASTDRPSAKDGRDFSLTSIRVPGGAAPRRSLLRSIGALVYCLLASASLVRLGYWRRQCTFWVCDPVMFPLVLILKTFAAGKVVWDHHELPPDWLLESGLLLWLFKQAYVRADCVVHVNAPRQSYLEERLGTCSRDSCILSNYPSQATLQVAEPSAQDLDWIGKRKFVFLQNSVSESRCGEAIFLSLKDAGYDIFHAGHVDPQTKARLDGGGDHVRFSGSLPIQQINAIMMRAEFTVICYRASSPNQIFCDPNRLYQAMALGVPVIIGSNPTMIGSVKKYSPVVVLSGDGSEIQQLREGIDIMTSSILPTSKGIDDRLVLSWEAYDADFARVAGH